MHENNSIHVYIENTRVYIGYGNVLLKDKGALVESTDKAAQNQ